MRQDGVFGSESHVHQGRTTHRQVRFPGRPPTSIPRLAYAGSIHPPKHETFDLTARTNTDPKGIVRAVEVYTVEPWGLYLARPTPGRDQFHYLESWLLPSLNLRVTIFHFNPGHTRDQDYYLDVGQYTAGPQAWSSEDHYLDLVVRTGREVELLDVDEMLTALRQGLISPESAERAVQTAVTTTEGLARHQYDLDRWLAEKDITLTWRDDGTAGRVAEG
jgi:predicted RNA-binding protein associated with RNAse of E/G family